MAMTQEEAFLAAIIETPDEDAPRLIYADWLEESGKDPARAEFIRAQIELAKLPERPLLRLEQLNVRAAKPENLYRQGYGSAVFDQIYKTPARIVGDVAVFSHGEALKLLSQLKNPSGQARVGSLASAPALFVDVTDGKQTVTGCFLEDGATSLHRAVLRIRVNLRVAPSTSEQMAEGERRVSFKLRDQELLAEHRRAWTPPELVEMFTFGSLSPEAAAHALNTLEFRRGFVEKITCPAEDWLAHADDVVRAVPLREVELTTLPTVEGEAYQYGRKARYRLAGTGKKWPVVLSREELAKLNADSRLGEAGRQVLCKLLWHHWPKISFKLPSPTGGWGTTNSTPMDDFRAVRERMEMEGPVLMDPGFFIRDVDF